MCIQCHRIKSASFYLLINWDKCVNIDNTWNYSSWCITYNYKFINLKVNVKKRMEGLDIIKGNYNLYIYYT